MTSNATRILLLGLVCCASAVAANPDPVQLRIGGAEARDGVYLAAQGSTVALAATTQPGSIISVVAMPLDGDEAAPGLVLMAGNPDNGQLSGSFVIPKGLAGLSFRIMAIAVSPEGEVSMDGIVVTIVDAAAR